MLSLARWEAKTYQEQLVQLNRQKSARLHVYNEGSNVMPQGNPIRDIKRPEKPQQEPSILKRLLGCLKVLVG